MNLLKCLLLSLIAGVLIVAAAPNAAGKKAKKIRIDVNSATEAELKQLPGIGDADATKIVQGRPYASKNELKKRKVVAAATYEQIKDRIVVRPFGSMK